MKQLAKRIGLVVAAALVAGCSAPVLVPCDRVDAPSLTRENRFSVRFDWEADDVVDLPTEKIEVSVTAVRPLTGPIEVVHVVGDTEAEILKLQVPDVGGSLTSVCTIAPFGGLSNCGASLSLPLNPNGYYYLRQNGNTVLEAGIAFWLCR